MRSAFTPSAMSALNESPTSSFEIRMTVSAEVLVFSSTTMLLIVADPTSGVCGYDVTLVEVSPIGPGCCTVRVVGELPGAVGEAPIAGGEVPGGVGVVPGPGGLPGWVGETDAVPGEVPGFPGPAGAVPGLSGAVPGLSGAVPGLS